MRTILAAAALAAVSLPAAASGGVFDMQTARSFCDAGPKGELESCISQQEQAGRWIDVWLVRGGFTRPDARRAFTKCQVRFGPDLRHAKLCLQDLEDGARRGGAGHRRFR